MDQTPPKEPRSPVNLRIKFRSESLEQFVERYAIDVSRGGIFIRTRDPLAVGTLLKLDFQYQGGAPLMAGDGTVVWIRELDPNRPTVPPGMGVRFDRLTPESQAVLEQLLTEKAAREKSASQTGAGGRRPSSMFAALEQNEAKTTVGPAPSAPSAAEPVVDANRASPPRYSIAAMPLVAQQGIPGSLTKPPQPQQPRGVTGGAPAAAPLTATDPAAPGGYKPLGNARNPFAVGGEAGAAKGDPAAVARMAATILGTGAKTPSAPPPSLRQFASAATGADDLDEEPTQIAGRVPAFLASDEDPTSVGTRPTADDSRITTEHPAASGRNLAKLTSSLNRPGPGSAPTSKETVRVEALPGSTGRVTGHISAQAAESPRTKMSLDSLPPASGGASSAPRRTGGDRSTDALLDPEARPSRAALGLPEQPRPFDPLAAFGSGPTAISDEPLPPTPPPAAPEPVRHTPAKAVAAPVMPATASAAKPPAKRSSGLMVGALVLVMGGAAFFVFRFFQSQASQVVSAPAAVSPTTAISPAPSNAEPTVPPAANPSKGEPSAPTQPAAAAKEEAPAATGEAKSGEAKSGEAKPAEAKPAEAKPAEAKPTEGNPSEAKAAETKPVEAKPPATRPASKPIAVAEPAGARKGVKPRKSIRGARETEAAVADAPVPPTPTPPSTAPAAPAGAASDAPPAGHQIRVTSKPSGADVAVDGQVVGQTPLSTGINDVSSPHFVSVRKEGFEPFEQMISATSAWAKGKPVKGQPAVPTLKINAKLKSSGGGAAAEGKAAGAEGTKEKEAGGGKSDPDSPVPPSDIAPAPAPAAP